MDNYPNGSEVNVYVIDEQIIVHPHAISHSRNFTGEAWVNAVVEIDGKKYRAEKYITLKFVPVEKT